MPLFDLLVRLWRVDQCCSGSDIVVAVSYGVTAAGKLTRGNAGVCELAKRVLGESKNDFLAFGVFTDSIDPQEEERLRFETFENCPAQAVVFVGTVRSTIEEAEKIKSCFGGLSYRPRSITVVTGACHSRTARWVWRKAFPDAEITVRSIPWEQEIDADNPMIFLRHRFLWLGVNVARHLAFRSLGYKLARKLNLRQPTSNK